MKYKNCFDYIKNCRRIFIFGTGVSAINFYKLMACYHIKVSGFIVSDEFICSIPIDYPYEVIPLSKYEFEETDGVIVAVNQQYHEEIFLNLNKIGCLECYFLGSTAKHAKRGVKRVNASEKNSVCPYCHSKSRLLYSGKDYNRFYWDDVVRDLNETFYLYQCRNCGLQFIGNVPRHLDAYYPDSYYGSVSLEDIKKAAEFDKVHFISRYKISGSLLEIGPSMGAFCIAAKEKGFDVSAIEMNSQCVTFLKDTLNIRAILSDKPEEVLSEDSQKYDVICLWHSLEHMPKPWEVLKACVNSLNKEGIIVIAVPNPKAFLIKIMGKYWPHFDFPRHLYGIPSSWLRAFCLKQNIEMVSCTSRTKINNFWNRFAWGKFFEFLSSGNPHAYDIGLKFKLFQKIEEKNGFGSTYIAVLRKQGEK